MESLPTLAVSILCVGVVCAIGIADIQDVIEIILVFALG
jgi:hypothetical protein